jgi:hypothetical protein
MIKLTTSIINFLFYFCFPLLKGYKIIENLVKNNNKFLWSVSILYDSIISVLKSHTQLDEVLPPILNIRESLFFRFIENLMYLDYIMDQIHQILYESKK